ncbi:MAG: hypothetical protein KME16_04280 [Scytolyngbya sp. HA4215-MV1]|nr:hypothetical protein [Scytolyngbya sp. HA4215-MV1]
MTEADGKVSRTNGSEAVGAKAILAKLLLGKIYGVAENHPDFHPVVE